MVTIAQAAKLFDVPQDQIKRAERWAYVPKATKGAYPLPHLVRGFAKYLSSGEVTLEEAGPLIGVSRQWIGKLIAEGYIAKTGRGNVTRDSVAAGYIRWIKDEDRRSTKSAAASRKDDAKTREIELRVAEREHRLIDIEEHDAVVDELIATFRSNLAGFPARVTREIAQRRRIENEVDELLRTVSARFAERGAQLRASGVSGATVAEADPG